jgi:nitrogen fixation-related uncharacterized protein
LEDEQHKNWIKLAKGLGSRQIGKQQFDRLIKILTILLAIFFVVVLIATLANVWGVKSPKYEQGYEAGYRASYRAAFNSNFYNINAGLGQNFSYNEGYRNGYDEGYPAGQLDLKSSR